MGLIDVELLNLLIKLDEWFEKKRTFQVSETLRGDVLSLFCDKTIRGNSSLFGDSSIPTCTSDNSNPVDEVQSANTGLSMDATVLHTARTGLIGRDGVYEDAE